MAVADSYGLFWNSDNGDRRYNADSMEKWLKKFFTSGVFEGDLQVLALNGMTVEVQTGYCNLFGKVGLFETANSITLPVAHSTYPRIDTIVVERNDADRVISLKNITGAYSGDNPSPTPPVWDESNGIYQLVLAQINVGAGVSTITQANILDTRAIDGLCGYITGTVEEVDFSQFAAQFTAYFNEFKNGNEAAFDEWFDEIKGQLSEDAAGHLQNEIDDLQDEVDAIIPTILTGTLTAGETTITFTDASITNDCFVDIYTNVDRVDPKTKTQSGNTITLTFKAQSVDVIVKLMIREG